ncbi:FHA domain-containing protein [Pseudooceanicola aestuarii]|uniref:FHA domain-containing protein n=1 Tax=Pseudooceanicola aestuarii TaxID=2697319 RepID=UPI0013D8116B|nr:FHA domain-containing protein [Pseudooceanicola aestuarii]
MAKTSGTYLFKILSGTQYGVEVALDAGSFTFGSGADADIQLTDMTLEPVHGTLRLAAGRIDLRSNGGAIATSTGLTVEGDDTEWHEIAQLDMVTAGTTRFAVGAPNARWTKLLAAGPATGAEDGAGGTGRSGASGGSTRALTLLTALGVLILLAIGANVLTGPQRSLAAFTDDGADSPLDQARAVLGGFDFTREVEATRQVDGTIDVTGYVQTQTERRAIQNGLAEIDAFVRRRIWVRDAIEGEVAALLQSQEVSIDSTLAPDGVLTLRGDILDPAKASAVTDLLEGQVFGLARLDDRLRTADDYLEEMRGLLDRVHLDGSVLLRRDGLLVEATGVVPREKIDAWVGFIQVYAKRFARLLPLRSYVALEGVEGSGTRPLIIGDPGALGAGLGNARVLTPDMFGDDAAPLTLDMLLGPDASQETDADAAVAPGSPAIPTLREAVATLAELRPNLLRQLAQQVLAGEDVDAALLQEAFAVVSEAYGLDGVDPAVLAQSDLFRDLADPQGFRDLVLSLVEADGSVAQVAAGAAGAPLSDVGLANRMRALLGLEPLAEGPDGPSPDAPRGFTARDGSLTSLLMALMNGTANLPEALARASGTDASGMTEGTPDLPPAPAGQGGAVASGDGMAQGEAGPTVAATLAGAGDGTGANAADAVAEGAPGQAGIAGNRPDGSRPDAVATAAGSPARTNGADGETAGQTRAEGTALSAAPIDADQARSEATLSDDAQDTPTALAADQVLPEGASGLLHADGLTFPVFDGDFRMDAGLTRLMQGLRQLARAEREGLDPVAGRAATLLDTGATATLLNLARMQADALDMGKSLLAMPRPLSALPIRQARSTCWEGSNIPVARVPAVLVWMDILSIDPAADLGQIEGDNRLLFMEAALSPHRLRRCLERMDTPYARMIVASSSFLSETEKNEKFVEYLFRNVPDFPMPLDGINLKDERYVQLADGNKLREGMAPSLQSRLSLIGDLGLLIRVDSGYVARLYGDALLWRVEES